MGVRIAALLLAAAAAFAAGPYPNRWVFVSNPLRTDADVDTVAAIVRTAAGHGLNGMVLSAGMDSMDLQPPAWLVRLRRVKEICDAYGIEIVPQMFSVGYGSAIGHDRNLAEGLPVRDALFVAGGGEARLQADPAVAYVNGGLEQSSGDKVAGFQLQDLPGQISFVDTAEFAEGAASLRYENLDAAPFGNARLMQEVAVKPYRTYRVTFQVKTEGLQPASAFNFQVLAYADGRPLAPWTPNVASTAGWRKLTWGFNSLGYERVRIYAGMWGARAGRFWLDDFQIEEVGLMNVLRREGTPLEVRAEGGDSVYEEGVDFLPVADRFPTFRYDHDPPVIRLLPGGRIGEGDRLRVSWYQGVSVNDGQVSLCMSEPRLYEIYAEQARRVHEALAPARYLLSMDEIRAAGSCAACRRRGISTAEILGDCFTREVAILRAVNPQAEVWTWSDMLDPNHNARDRYYLVEGDYTGSWNYVPADLGILCWYYDRRVPSLAHFSSFGFRTMAGAYYDGDNLDNPKGWLDALSRTPGAAGILYTTWQNKYGLLADFGDLVSAPLPPE